MPNKICFFYAYHEKRENGKMWEEMWKIRVKIMKWYLQGSNYYSLDYEFIEGVGKWNLRILT